MFIIKIIFRQNKRVLPLIMYVSQITHMYTQRHKFQTRYVGLSNFGKRILVGKLLLERFLDPPTF